VRNKNTIHTNPSQYTLLPNPTTVQLNRVDIPASPLKVASKTAFSTTSSREIFNNTTSNQLKSPLFDNDDSDESINDTTDGLGELDTAPADEPTQDYATQSSTTATTLKLDDISCAGNGVENKRGDDSSFTYAKEETLFKVSTTVGLGLDVNITNDGAVITAVNNSSPLKDIVKIGDRIESIDWDPVKKLEDMQIGMFKPYRYIGIVEREFGTDTPADVPLQSTTTSSSLKLDIACVGNVSDNRADIDPSPTNAEADRPEELVDRLNEHLYPAPAVEKSDAVDADSDVDMVNDREQDVVVSVDTGIESDVHHFTECNARDTITIDGIYGSVPIPTIFSSRGLSKVIVEVPSIGQEDTLGIIIKHNHIFARAQIASVSGSSSLHTQISSKYINNIILAIEYEKEMPPCTSSNCKTIIEQLNTARANGPVVISLILARPFHNTLEGARSQLELKLKKENYNDADEVEQRDIDQAVEVINECLEHIYNHPAEFEQFFFKDLSQFTILKDAEKKGKIGGVYIGEKQSHIYLKFGTSMSNCKNREDIQKLLNTWLFCTDKEALDMIPPQFIDRLMALSNLPCMQFDPTQHLSKEHYFAIIIIEAILSCIHPAITNTVGDLVVQALPAHLKAIADPHVSRELIAEIRELGYGLPDDLIQFLLTWPKLSDDIDWRRQHAKSIPSLAKYDLFNQHLKQPKECLKIFLYREIVGPMFYDFKDCVEISPRMIRLVKIVRQLEHIMTDDVLSQFEEGGTVDDSVAEELYNVLSSIMKFGEDYEEYESPSDVEVAAGCVEILPKLLEYLPPNIIIFIETSIYKALRNHENAFFCSTFDESECKDVLPDDRLKFIRINDGRRVIVGGTTFVAFSQDTGLPQIESSLQAQNALVKVLAALGSIDAETATKILAKKKSYLAWLHFGRQEDDTDHDECDVDDELDIASSSGDESNDTLDEPSSSGRFYMSRRHHLPSDMCTGHIPSGLQCLLNIIPVQYRTLIFLCVELEGLRFRLLLKALGGKVPIGPNTPLPIDANGTSTCGGILAIGRFASRPCTCKKGGAHIHMFKAQDPKDPLFGHLVCDRCYSSTHERIKIITAEIEAYGIDINQIIKIQPQILATINTFATDGSLVATVEVMKHVMQQNGLSLSDTNDDNLVNLLIEWSRGSKLQTFITFGYGTKLNRPVTLDITLVRGTKSFDFREDGILGIKPQQAQDGTIFFGEITPDSQADRAGIISGDVPLVNGKPVGYSNFITMAAQRPLIFDVKRYAYQQFYNKSSKAYIHRQDLRLFNVGTLREMLKIKAGISTYIDGKAVKYMKKPELIDRLGTMIEDSSDTVGQE